LERDPLVRGLLLMLAAIGLVWLGGWAWQIVSRFGDVILLFFLAWLLAFILSPVARWLQRRGAPKLPAVGAVYAGLALIMATVGITIVPAVVAQLIQLGASLPSLANDLQDRADELHAALIAFGLPEAQLADFYRNAIGRAEAIGTSALSNSLAVAGAIFGSVLSASLVLILSFYIMLDGDRIGANFIRILPPRYQESASTGFEHVDRTFGGFVRGQLVVALVYGFGTYLVMQLAGLSFSLVLSIFAGVMMLIPIIGPVLAMTPPIVLAIIQAPQTTWWVALLLFVLQFVVVNVLAPKVMSQSIGIHPLLIFAALLVGTQVAQGWGAIFGVPVAAVLVLLIRVFYQRVVLRTPLYRQGAALSVNAIAPPAMTPSAAAPAQAAPDGSDQPDRRAEPPDARVPDALAPPATASTGTRGRAVPEASP
jgi:predicted PurR-regulated permease PerM